MKKSYNYKVLIGIIIGFVISVIEVYAATSYSSSEVYYYNTNSTLSSDDVQGAIDELADKYSDVTGCLDGFECAEIKTTLEVGDYVSYTPSKTSYTTSTTYTGYDSTQTINPSELTLWRVISVNDDGTVDIISEHVSSVSVYFSGITGYVNFVGYLNVLASQYENSKYTSDSRYFGYNGQTEYIADEDASLIGTSDADDATESQGGGDTLYTVDYDLVYDVLGTRVATNNNGTVVAYWIASRAYSKYSLVVAGTTSSTTRSWSGRNLAVGGSLGTGTMGLLPGTFYYFRHSASSGNSYSSNSVAMSLRPIVTLKSGLSYSGLGTEDYPMEITS